MSVAKIIEITATSKDGFDDAVRRGVERAAETVNEVRSAWLKDQEVIVDGNQIREYRVTLKVTFVLNGGGQPT